MKNTDNDRPNYLRFASAGLELAGAMLVPAAIGWYVDSVYQWETPWGFLVGGILGFSAGMYNFVRKANEMNR